MTIRPAALPADLAAILALERRTPTAPHWPPEAYLGEPGSRIVLVAVAGQTLVGFAVASAVAGEAELESVAVAEGYRRQGIGEALCRAAIAWAWDQQAEALRLEVRASSAGALRLYQRLGFTVEGRRPAYYHDPTDDALLLRLLRPAAAV